MKKTTQNWIFYGILYEPLNKHEYDYFNKFESEMPLCARCILNNF